MERDLRYRLNWMKGLMAVGLGVCAGGLVLGATVFALQRLHLESPEGRPLWVLTCDVVCIYLMIGLSSLAAGVTAAWHQSSWPERFNFPKKGGAYAFWVSAGWLLLVALIFWLCGGWQFLLLLPFAAPFVPLAGLIGRRIERK